MTVFYAASTESGTGHTLWQWWNNGDLIGTAQLMDLILRVPVLVCALPLQTPEDFEVVEVKVDAVEPHPEG